MLIGSPSPSGNVLRANVSQEPPFVVGFTNPSGDCARIVVTNNPSDVVVAVRILSLRCGVKAGVGDDSSEKRERRGEI